jgi:hypothetical protein
MFIITADDLPRLMLCNGSRLMPPSFPATSTDTTARDEGIAAHYMASAIFNQQYTLEEAIDRKAPNGVYMTAEMAEHVGEYLSALDCGEMEVETSFGGQGWQINGRCDHRKVVDFGTMTLTIDDLKYGWRPVDPEMNWMLIAHAIGTCIGLQIAPDVIVLRIHQPRPHHPDGKLREWRITYPELMELYAQINATLSNLSDELRTGPVQCPKCPALATCPAARKAGFNAIDAIDMMFDDDVSNELLSYELTTIEYASGVLETRLKALRELALHRVKQGQVVPEYAAETQYANTRWKSGLTAPILSVMTGKDLSTNATVTPAEAKRRGVPEDVVKSLTERPQTGLKLVKVNAHKRAERLLGKKG